MTNEFTFQAARWALLFSSVGTCAVALLVVGGFTPVARAAGESAGATGAPSFQFKPWPRGKVVPSLEGVDLQGNSWNLKDLRGQPVLINFWASWCEPCRAEMPSLQALAERGEPREGQPRANTTPIVLAINFKESSAAAQRFMNHTQLRLPVLLDSDGAMARQWGVTIFPSTVLIGADGKVRGTVVGELDWMSPAAQPVLRR